MALALERLGERAGPGERPWELSRRCGALQPAGQHPTQPELSCEAAAGQTGAEESGIEACGSAATAHSAAALLPNWTRLLRSLLSMCHARHS